MKIIAFEGIDASGKETQAKMLKEYLESEGKVVKLDSFPRYETPIGNIILQVLQGELDMDPQAFHMLYEVDRLDYQRTLNQYKASGLVDYVIIDRYFLSNLAYSVCKGLDLRVYTNIHKKFTPPDAYIVLDIDAETSFKRRIDREDLHERDLTYLSNVVYSYRELSKGMKNISLIKTDDLSTDDTHKAVKSLLFSNNLI